MKHAKLRRAAAGPAYPNAASRGYYFRKLVDVLTAIASGIGFLAVLLFLFLL